ncbi:MAG TPA: penicillin-binding transpeptidase domain-containing protein [Pyrinomonadaceae bacterium]|nr:penicillin-binding transpeptidase domain-containing protein [Pyrinomonadaceae bacterium]
MKTSLFVIFLILLFSFPSATAQPTDKIERQILTLNRLWADAMVSGDVKSLENLFSDDLIVTSGSGAVRGKREELEDVRPHPDLKTYFFNTEDVRVRVYANAAAVVTGRAKWRINYKGKDIDHERRYTSVYAREKSGWRMTALQLTRIAPPAPAQQKLSAIFKDTTGTFVLYDAKNNAYVRYNEARAKERFSPKSTFKIPNSLIGLETGVIKDADFVIGWNREKYAPQANWNQEPFVHWGKDHALRTAFKYSVLWYYRELAQKVGLPEMKARVAALAYGNKQVSGAVDNFWLDNSLKISAEEQVEFLRAFYENRLPVSRRSTEILKDIMVFEKTPGYTLSAKTGGGPIAEGKYIGWFVGYLEAASSVYYFATNIEGASFAEIRDKRIEMTKKILTELEYLPKQEK